MSKSHVSFLLFFFFFGSVYSEEPVMYLCIDSMKQKFDKTGVTPPKLVYGYIDGQKTECMSEHELRAEFSRHSFQKSRASEPDSQQLLDQKGLRREVSSGILRKSIKEKKNLAESDLRGYDLKGVDLSRADLRKANLESADLRSAKLEGADLSGANLQFAYLKHAKLKNAKFTDANLKGAYFQGADLRGAIGLDLEKLREVTTLHNAILDSVLMDQVKEYCPAKLKDPGWQWHATYFPQQEETPKDQRANRKQFR